MEVWARMVAASDGWPLECGVDPGEGAGKGAQMKVGMTGATGFLGRYIVANLAGRGHRCRCWTRSGSDRGGFEAAAGLLEWVEGGLRDEASARALVEGCDAVVHAALDR